MKRMLFASVVSLTAAAAFAGNVNAVCAADAAQTREEREFEIPIYTQKQLKERKAAEKFLETADLTNPTVEIAVKVCTAGDAIALKTIEKNNFRSWDAPDIIITAAYYGEDVFCRFLISKGADVNAKDEFLGETPLHAAVRGGRYVTTKYLVSQGADVNAASSSGNTPLSCSSSEKISQFLISKGADVNAKNTLGWTPLYSSAVRGDEKHCKYLLSQGAKLDACRESILLAAATGGNLDLCKYFVSLGADVEGRDSLGNTVLHNAAQKGSVELCKYFVSLGVNVNAKNRFSKTALRCAEEKKNVPVVNYLRSIGAY